MEKKTYENITDEELIKQMQSGDEKAEEELFFRYKDLVMKIARGYYIVGGELEDLIQEGMIGFYRALKAYDTTRKDAKFKTFAITCIKHQIQAAITKANSKRNQTLSRAISFQSFNENIDSVEDFLPLNLIVSDSPADKIIDKENYENLKILIRKTLSQLEFNVLKFYLQGYSYREMAKILNITEKSIDNCLSRIKSKLRKSLNS